MKKFLKSEKIAFEKLKYEENINWKNKNETLSVTEKVQFIYSSDESYMFFSNALPFSHVPLLWFAQL